MLRRSFVALSLLLLLAIAVPLLLLLMARPFPPPTGPHAVSRTSLHWVDATRSNSITGREGPREVQAQVWYPAAPGIGMPDEYFPELSRLSQALVDSGELSPVEALGLPMVDTNRLRDADISQAQPQWPLVLLSPGHGTNVEFYAGIAEELASHGFIVSGINHPYDVGAVALENGDVAQLEKAPMEVGAHMAHMATRVDVRKQDLLFALKAIQQEERLAGHIDAARVAVMGHSVGGIAAAQASKAEPTIKACINLDGIQAGGPFSAEKDPEPAPCPFLFVTKEEMPEGRAALMRKVAGGAWHVRLPGASHDNFTDGPVLLSLLLPISGSAQRYLAQERTIILEFLQARLNGMESPILMGGEHMEGVEVVALRGEIPPIR